MLVMRKVVVLVVVAAVAMEVYKDAKLVII
jgi:hypothetical protein